MRLICLWPCNSQANAGAKEVVFTDLPAITPITKQNVDAHVPGDSACRVSVCDFDWCGEPPAGLGVLDTFDVVLGADLVYKAVRCAG